MQVKCYTIPLAENKIYSLHNPQIQTPQSISWGFPVLSFRDSGHRLVESNPVISFVLRITQSHLTARPFATGARTAGEPSARHLIICIVAWTNVAARMHR